MKSLEAIEPTPKRRGVSRRLVVAVVMAMTLTAYVGTLGYQFVYDDRSQIVDNRTIKSWHYVSSYFTGHSWHHLYPRLLGNYYRPVFLVWSLTNHTLFGLNAFWWHLMAVALHVAATMFVYLLARRLLKDQPAAIIAAMIFGLHPVHIEAVAWVSGATESLLAITLIPALLCYLNWRGDDLTQKARRNRKWFAASLVFYCVAMFAKETALILPMLVCAYEWIYGFRGSGLREQFNRARFALLRSVPYIALTCGYLIIRLLALSGLSHAVTPLPKSTILFTWPSLLWFYIKLLFWPVGLSAFYDTPYVTAPGFKNFYLPLLAVIAVGMVLWVCARRSREVAFASALLLLPVLPLLNLSVFIRGEIVHDRYLYLPSVGFSIMMGLALRRINFGTAKFLGQPALQFASVVTLAALLGFATSAQSFFWSNDLLLYYRGVTMSPNSDLAKNNLANEMVDRGMLEEAINLYAQVLERNPEYWLANYNLGFAYYKMGMYEEAERNFTRALEINQQDADEFARLSLTQMKLDRLDDAESSMRRAIELRPEGPGYHYALGVILRKKGNHEGALGEFKAELINDPAQMAAHDQIQDIEASR